MKINFNPVTQDPPEGDGKFPPSVRTFTINSHGYNLLGSILLAGGEELHPSVIILNGFPGNDSNMDIAHAVRRAGFNAVHFNYRGSWGSDGDYSWSNCIEDSKVVIEYFRSKEAEELYRCDSEKIILVGHSMGGFISLMNAVTDSSIKNVCSFAGFNYGLWADFIKDNEEIKNMSLERMDESVKLLRGTSAQNLLTEMIVKHDEWNLLNNIKKLSNKNLLLIAAKYDQLAPVELHHAPLVSALKKAGSNFTGKIISSGHSFSDKRIELTKEIINWLVKIEF